LFAVVAVGLFVEESAAAVGFVTYYCLMQSSSFSAVDFVIEWEPTWQWMNHYGLAEASVG
jgi:hypothetical protein